MGREAVNFDGGTDASNSVLPNESAQILPRAKRPHLLLFDLVWLMAGKNACANRKAINCATPSLSGKAVRFPLTVGSFGDIPRHLVWNTASQES